MQNSHKVSWRDTVQEWKQHWRLGLTAFIGSGLSFSVWTNLSSLFIQPWQDTFGWSRGDIALGQNATLVAALLAPVFGRLMDRIGVRRVLLTGLLCAALLLLLMSQMPGSLPLYYLLYGLLAVAGITTTGLSYTRIICGSFEKTRGLALAVTRGGLAVAGALLPALVFAVISHWGWRAGMATLGVLMLLFAWPLVWLWVRPAAMTASAASPASGSLGPKPLGPLLRSPKVWALTLGACFAYLPLVSSFSQMAPLLTSKGLSSGEAASVLGVIGLAALAGATVTGFLVDRFWAPAVATLFTLTPIIGFVILIQGNLTPWSASLAIFLLGFGYGAEIDLLAFMAARYFGLGVYGTVYGLSTLSISVGASFGVSVFGLVYDRFHSYDPALYGGMGVLVVATLCYLSLGRYPRAEASAA